MGQREQWLGRIAATACAAGLALIASAGSAAAQQGAPAGEELDAGRFAIRVGDRAAGTEVFAIRRVGTKVRAVGRMQVENGGGALWPFEVRMQTNADFEPEIYELRFMEGPTQTVVGRRTETGLLIHSATDAGERFKEFATEPGTLIVEQGTAHHYVLMFERLSRGGAVPGGNVPVLVPSRNMEANARISRIDVTTRSVSGRDVRVARYDVQLDGQQAEVWVDPGGRVLRISMPDSGWMATRTEGE